MSNPLGKRSRNSSEEFGVTKPKEMVVDYQSPALHNELARIFKTMISVSNIFIEFVFEIYLFFHNQFIFKIFFLFQCMLALLNLFLKYTFICVAINICLKIITWNPTSNNYVRTYF